MTALRKYNAKRNSLTVEYVKTVVRYCPTTGNFYRCRGSSRSPAGSVTGSKYSNGYIRISIDCTEYLAHRLAWFLTYCEWPNVIDHINGDKTDNRIANLRTASRAQNNANMKLRRDNISGLKGVGYRKRDGRFMARIVVSGKTRYLGTFDTAEAAHAAYMTAAQKFYEDFARAS